jgi:hypothetical protein
MHAFALVLASFAGHVWARTVITDAQRVVSYIRSSTLPANLVRQAAKALGVKGGGLQSSNKTRFTSVVDCLASVARNHLALTAVLESGDIKNAEVTLILQSEPFWRRLKFLCRLLEPFAQVVMAMQHRTSTLSDVTRYFCWLGARLSELESEFEDGECGAQHVQAAPLCCVHPSLELHLACMCSCLQDALRVELQPARGRAQHGARTPGAVLAPSLPAGRQRAQPLAGADH